MTKKGLICVIVLCCMISQFIVVRAFNPENYIINDEFDIGTDGWVVGAIDGSKTTPAEMSNVASYTDANGVTANGVLKVDVGTPAEYYVGGQPNIFRGLDTPYTYKDGVDLVIKTRVLHTSSSGRFDLMHNRYNTIDKDTTGASITDNAYSGHYMLFDVKGSSNNLSYPSGVSGNTVNQTQLISTSSIANKWIDVEMVIDGKNDRMTITATVDGITETATTSITQPNSVYIRDGADPATGWTTPLKAHFDELKSLTFLQRSGTDTLYIDYVTAYEKIEASMKVDTTYKKGQPIVVTFDTKAGTEKFKDAVELYDEDGNKIITSNAIDDENMIVTITPQISLTDGAEYVVKIKDGVIPSIYNIDLQQKSFKVSSRSYIIDDSFTFGADGWVVGAIDDSKTAPAEMTTVSSYTDANGVTANGVLKIDVGTPAEYNVGGQPNIFRGFETPYEYKDDANVVIKTRVLHTSTSGRFDLMHNRYNTIDKDTTGASITDNAYSGHYMLFDVKGSSNNLSYPSGVSGNTVNQTQLISTSSIANKWIDVEMVIDGKNDRMTITATVDGITETATTSITQPNSVYIRDGADPATGWTTPLKAHFDELKSLTFLQRSGEDTIYIDYVEVYELPLPKVSNILISGHVFPGEKITVSYNYDCEVAEGASLFQWYMAESEGGPWTEIVGATEKTLTVSEEASEKFIKVEVTPISNDNRIGKKVESNVLTYEKAPTASNLRTSPSVVYAGLKNTALYDYYDINGDTQGDTQIKWEIAENPTGTWTEFGAGSTIFIPETENGKYIRFSVTPNSVSNYNPIGTTKVSEVYGPIYSFLSESNLFANPSIETGVLMPWQVFNSSASYGGLEVCGDAAYDGSYSLHIYPRIDNQEDQAGQAVTLDSGNRYIISCMAKKFDAASSDIQGFRAYIFNLNDGLMPFENQEIYDIDSSFEWENVISTVDIVTSGVYNIGFLSLLNQNHDVLIDNMYCGKLLITDIETIEPAQIVIPETGTVTVPITTGKVFNQLGTTNGLDDQIVSITADKTGVSVSGNDIIINSSAITGKVNIELSCIPSYNTTALEEYKKVVEIQLIAPANKKPMVTEVSVSGTLSEGNTLTGIYSFYQVEGKADGSEYKWLFSDELSGNYSEIPGATDKEFIVTDEFVDKFIKFEVIPKTADGLVGTEQLSDALLPLLVPTVANITVTGDFSIGGEITGSYNFYDINGDSEGASIFKWYISDSENGTYSEIDGQNGKKLTLTSDMVDKYIKFGVTPVSTEYPPIGEECLSNALLGPTAPYITNLSIQCKDNLLIAKYDYHHAHNAKENNSLYKWEVDGKTVSTNESYVINFVGTKTVKITVTPCGETNPRLGTPISCTESITGNKADPVTATGSSGGGSGGGGFFSVAGVNTAPTNIMPPGYGENSGETSDLSGHWGEKYVMDLVSRGVMSADENGKYNPDETVTRESMLTYLFKALNLEITEYTGIFNDVANGDFGKMLQTMVDNGTIARDVAFRPNDSISREEMCKILYVSLENAGKLKETEDVLINNFADFDDISEWARKYVNAIYGNRIMIGVSEDCFAPREKVTKAQAATMLVKITSLIQGE